MRIQYMSTLKAFVEKAVGDGIKETGEFEEIKRILDAMDRKEKPIYLKCTVTTDGQ